MQTLLIFTWLNFVSTNPTLTLLPQTRRQSCNPLLPEILKFVVAGRLNTAEELAELQLLLILGEQLIGLVPLWLLMTSSGDCGTIAQSSFFLL